MRTVSLQRRSLQAHEQQQFRARRLLTLHPGGSVWECGYYGADHPQFDTGRPVSQELLHLRGPRQGGEIEGGRLHAVQ